MRPTIAFAVAYLCATGVGLAAGYMLPLWASGVAGWSMFIASFVWAWWREPAMTYCGPARRIDVCVSGGLLFGGLAGAAAADVSEALDALVWPGHEVDAVLVAIGVALAWLLGTIVTEEDEAAFRPGVVGLGLYLVTVALAVFPAVSEVFRGE